MNIILAGRTFEHHFEANRSRGWHGRPILPLGMLLLLLLLAFAKPSAAQVYNYNPINYRDIESNPSILASYAVDKRISYFHQNNFSSTHPAFHNNLNVSKYFPYSFLGLGLSISNTNMQNKNNYYHMGVGIGYRNVLFNKLFLKFGACYKIIYANTPPGEFDYFAFDATGITHKKFLKDNLNLALSLSNDFERFYFSFSVLNVNLPWNINENSIHFPTYYVFNLGNLWSLIHHTNNSEISYTAFIKTKRSNNVSTLSQYVNLRFNLAVTRRAGLNYGSRIGYADNSYFLLAPFITYYRKHVAVSASYNFHFGKKNIQSIPQSTTQFSILYNP